MSFDAAALQFFTNIRLDEGERTWFEEQLLKDLPELASSAPWPSSPSGCPLADMGNYVVRVLHILATVAENLLRGDFISAHIDEKMEDLVAEDDLHTANLLDDKHAALKEISNKLNQALKDCEQSWSSVLAVSSPAAPSIPKPTPRFEDFFPPQILVGQSQSSADVPIEPHTGPPMADEYDTVGYSMPARDPPYNQNAFAAYSPSWTAASSGNVGSGETQTLSASSSSRDASNDGASPEDASQPVPGAPPLERLKSRGKGNYTCPHGHNCNKKGGIQPNGELTIFTRNSAFRAHWQLHERNFKCDLPGCTNTKGFARIDQLERHKRTVQHNPPGTVYFTPS